AADTQNFFSVVDLHAITVPQDPRQLRTNTLDMAVSLLACGIDPKRSVLFRQSKVPQHAELAWILFCRTPIGWLSRMHQWKTKLQTLQATGQISAADTAAAATLSMAASSAEFADKDEESAAPATTTGSGGGPPLGLLAYPVLMASDILLYR
ncbi:hypothetical protein HK405_000337, partial [Cladochytrium tenue]